MLQLTEYANHTSTEPVHQQRTSSSAENQFISREPVHLQRQNH